MVLSADLKSILINEGVLYEGKTQDEVERDTREFKQYNPFKSARITPTTNRGVRIGMTRSQVEGILGKPKAANSFFSKKFNAHELIYSRQTPTNKHGLADKYTNYYLFRGGKLFYIEISYDLLGGA